MAKTQLTCDIEEALYFYGLEQDEIVMREVSVTDGRGVVDTFARRTKPDGTHEWRCYEIKVSKTDFKSTAKVSFIGHYNYYVMPKPLYDAVKDEIPGFVGAIVYLPFDSERCGGALTKGSLSIVKKASRQELSVDEQQLKDSLFNSMFRKVHKTHKLEKGLLLYGSDELLKELSRRYKGYDVFHPERNMYHAFAAEIEQDAAAELRDELSAVSIEYNELKEKIRQNRRMTEPYL